MAKEAIEILIQIVFCTMYLVRYNSWGGHWFCLWLAEAINVTYLFAFIGV